MQKFLLMSFVLGLSGHSFGADLLPQELASEYKCKVEVQKELEKQFAGHAPTWERTADPSFDTQAFRAQSGKVGEWYELQIPEKENPKLIQYSSAKTTEWSWKKNCKVSSKKSRGLEFFKSTASAKAESFNDSDMAKILTEKKAAMIYVWSPRMVYSVSEFTRMRALAEKRKMEFIPVLDPMADSQEARDAMKKGGVDLQFKTASLQREPSSIDLYRKLNSVELFMRNGTLHYPTVFVTSNGKIHSRRLIGVLTNDDMNAALDEMTGDLK